MNRNGEVTMTKIAGLIILAIIITGCQTTSGGVQVIGPDTFEITKQEHNIFGGGAPGAEQSANEEAQKKCASQNKQLLVKRSRTRFERPFYRNTIVFRCLSDRDREYKRPKIRSSGRIRNQQNVIIQNNGANAGRSLPQKSLKSTLVEQVQIPIKFDWEAAKNNPKGFLLLPNLKKWKESEVPLVLKMGALSCEGSSIAKSGNLDKGEVSKGVFYMKCDNGHVLTGTYVSPKLGEGIGVGKDDKGRPLTFVYGKGAL
jgi:hypothetical protein